MTAIYEEKELELLNPTSVLAIAEEFIWSLSIPGVGFKVSTNEKKGSKSTKGSGNDSRSSG